MNWIASIFCCSRNQDTVTTSANDLGSYKLIRPERRELVMKGDDEEPTIFCYG